MGGTTLGALGWKNIVRVLGEYRETNLRNLVEGLGAVFIRVLVFFNVGVPSRNKVIDLVFGSRIGSGGRCENGWKTFAASAGTGSNPEQRHDVVQSIGFVEVAERSYGTESHNDIQRKTKDPEQNEKYRFGRK